MAVGLPPYDTRPYSENVARVNWNPAFARRQPYP